jgi:hypothetical protein
MDAAAWIALGGAVVTMLVNVGAYLIAWGSMRATVSANARRIDDLEREMETVGQLKVAVGEVKTSITFILEQLKDLNSSIRWMREPVPYSPPGRRPHGGSEV